MFGFGKKKSDEGGAPTSGGVQEEKEILDKVTFHIMPKVGETAALELANVEEKKNIEGGKDEKKKDAAKPAEAPRPGLAPAQPARRPSLAPPPPPAPKPAVAPPPLLAKQPPLPHGAAKITPIGAPSKKKWVVVGIIVAVLLIAGGAGGWYWYRFVRVTPETGRGALTLSPGDEFETPETTGESQGVEITPSVLAPVENHMLADRGLVSTRDSDADLLTDVEEELFGTDPNLPDTDIDGWPDGWEIVHLYDPAQGNAKRLIESARLTAFTNDAYGYAVLYPNTWVAQAIDVQDTKDVILTSATGEFIQITAEPYGPLAGSLTGRVDAGPGRASAGPGESATSTLEEAYLREKYPGGSAYTLHPVLNKFNVRGFQTSDGLTVFLEGHNTLYVVRYMPGLRAEINFKRTMTLLIAGFLVNEGVPPAITAAARPPTVFDVVEPTVTSTPAATSTSVI